MRGTFQAILLASLLTAPTALAADVVVTQPASHFVSVRGAAAAEGAAQLTGGHLYYEYAAVAYPVLPRCEQAVATYQLVNPATGAQHTPIVREGGGKVQVRMDGPTTGWLAAQNGGAALTTIELWIVVQCVMPSDPPQVNRRLVATIGVSP